MINNLPDNELPLFPLSNVLLPYGRMPLQIFEQRYLTLVRDCMKTNSGFGVSWIRSGSEVSGPGKSEPELAAFGTVAKIVDWDQLPNNLLGITIEGQDTFELCSTQVRRDGLIIGDVKPHRERQSAPVLEEWQGLETVLRSLETHPHVQRMNLGIDYDNAWQLGYTLIQLLPLEESVKYDLLAADGLPTMMRELDSILNDISGEG